MAKLTTEEFIEKAVRKHGNNYSYERSEYTGAKSKLIVTCKDHGDFLVTPTSHADDGKGCPGCKRRKLSLDSRSTTEEFITKARARHADRYDYSEVVYVNQRTAVSIRCPEHGVFQAMPGRHLHSGASCPSCTQSSGYRANKPGWLYILSAGNVTKIGITNRTVGQRLKELVRASAQDYTEVHSYYFQDGSEALKLETFLLDKLRSVYEQPKDVYNGSTECFVDVNTDELLKAIRTLTTTASN